MAVHREWFLLLHFGSAFNINTKVCICRVFPGQSRLAKGLKIHLWKKSLLLGFKTLRIFPIYVFLPVHPHPSISSLWRCSLSHTPKGSFPSVPCLQEGYKVWMQLSGWAPGPTVPGFFFSFNCLSLKQFWSLNYQFPRKFCICWSVQCSQFSFSLPLLM